jgi:group I intron endonuclease
MLIYCIKNTINNKEYVGLTTRSLEDRWKQHVYESNKQDSWEWNTPLGNAIKKYGKDSFEVSVLFNCNSVEELKQKEIELIEQRKSLVEFGGYNITKGGDGRLGAKHSEETKRKIGLKSAGKIMSIEARDKMSIAAKKRCVGKPSPMDGKKHTTDSIEKIRLSSTGRFFSEESRKKKSESLKAYHMKKKQLELGILNG